MANQSLEELLGDQRKVVSLAIIEEIENDNDNVRITPWVAGRRGGSANGILVPRAAIKSIKRIGREVVSAGRVLHAVEVEFTDAKLLTYQQLFSALRGVRGENAVPWKAISEHANKGPEAVFGRRGLPPARHDRSLAECIYFLLSIAPWDEFDDLGAVLNYLSLTWNLCSHAK